MFVGVVGIPLGIWLAFMGAVLWLAARFGGRSFVWGLTVLGALILCLFALDVFLACSAPTEFIPPTPEQEAAGGVGKAIHACDGPSGLVAYATLYLTFPLAFLGQGLLTWWMLGRTS